MTTTVAPNDYKMEIKTAKTGQILHTNSTTRILKKGELVCVIDAKSQFLMGFVVEPAGIAASGGIGRVDMLEGQEVTTNQFTTATFVPGDVQFWVAPQTNGSEAKITLASASTLVPLDALVKEYTAGVLLRFRMPYQAGTAIAVP